MKRLIFFIGLLLSFSNLYAQKKITKNNNTSGINNIDIHLKFAENIVLKNWNKNEVSVQASVNINNNKNNDVFSLETQKDGETLHIKSKYGDYFNKKGITINNKKCSNCNNCYNHNEMHINYVIYVPKKMEVKIKSISGNVNAISHNGFITLNLISGNITIKKSIQNMNLKTISGDIDLGITNASFKAETLTGTVYSDLDIQFDRNNNNLSGSKIYGKVNNGDTHLKLKTISGNIYLRKI